MLRWWRDDHIDSTHNPIGRTLGSCKCILLIWKKGQPTTETIVPLKKGFPFVISFVANPGPLGQSSSYSGVFFTGHSSHSSVPQAAPTEQQQASMRWRPAMGRVHSSSSYLRKQVSMRISAREQREHEESYSVFFFLIILWKEQYSKKFCNVLGGDVFTDMLVTNAYRPWGLAISSQAKVKLHSIFGEHLSWPQSLFLCSTSFWRDGLVNSKMRKSSKESYLLIFSSIHFTSTCVHIHILLDTHGVHLAPIPNSWDYEEE